MGNTVEVGVRVTLRYYGEYQLDAELITPDEQILHSMKSVTEKEFKQVFNH